MARKRLIKGSNAARLEERIARVPEDLGPGREKSIFGAIAEMEKGSSPRAKAPAPKARPAGAKTKATERAREEAEEEKSEKPPKLGPANFTSLEREAIVRCCEDYRNRLPTYLQSVQREVRVIDAVIEKCKARK
jgi:hypothetical protein